MKNSTGKHMTKPKKHIFTKSKNWNAAWSEGWDAGFKSAVNCRCAFCVVYKGQLMERAKNVKAKKES